MASDVRIRSMPAPMLADKLEPMSLAKPRALAPLQQGVCPHAAASESGKLVGGTSRDAEAAMNRNNRCMQKMGPQRPMSGLVSKARQRPLSGVTRGVGVLDSPRQASQLQPPTFASTAAPAAGSLLTRLELITGEKSQPAAALIKFAQQVSSAIVGPFHANNQKLGAPTAPAITGFEGGNLRSNWRLRPRDTVLLPRSFHAPRHALPGIRASHCPSVRAYGLMPSMMLPGDPTPEDRAIDDERIKALEVDNSKESEKAADTDEAAAGKQHEELEEHHKADTPKVAMVFIELPWSEAELKAVFKKFSDYEDQEVRTDVLPALLRYLGARPKEEEVHELVCDLTQYASVNWSEFMEFMQRYREFDLKMLREMFDEADIDGSGELDFDELHLLLQMSGMSPTTAVTLEALNTIDEDGSGTVVFEEFEKLREHLRATAGFMKVEADELRRLYNRAARGADKKLTIEDLWRISTYIGYSASQATIRRIVDDIWLDSSSLVGYDEYLKIIRDIRDHERAQVEKMFSHRGIGGKPEGRRRTHRLKTVTVEVAYEESPPQPPPQTSKSPARTIVTPTQPRRRRMKADRGEGGPKIGSSNLRGSRSKANLKLPRTIAASSLVAALPDIGYFAPEELVAEIVDEMKEEIEEPSCLSIEEFHKFLSAFRRKEGFTKAELSDLHFIFSREQSASVAGDDDESLDCLELGRVLRWFGISKTLQQAQRLIEQVDFDGSGQLEFHEFTKLMRQLLQAEARTRRLILNSLDKSHSGAIPASVVSEAVRLIADVEPDQKMIDDALDATLPSGVDVMDMGMFEAFYTKYKGILVEQVRQNAGYIPFEVQQMRRTFKEYDKNCDGRIEGAELRTLIAHHIPEATQSKEAQAEMQRILKEICPAKEQGVLNFSRFLWLMRRTHDNRDEIDISREARVLEEYKFTPEEVEGYRHLFSGNVNWAGELTIQALVRLFEPLLKFNATDVQELKRIVQELNPDGRDVIRFPQFLVLMRKLQLENVMGLSDAAERAIKRRELLDARRERARMALIQ